MHRLLRLDRHECELQLVVRGEEAQERPGTTSPEGRAVLADRTRLPALHSLPTNHDNRLDWRRLSFCYWREGGYHRDAPPRGTLLTARGQRSDTAGIFSHPPALGLILDLGGLSTTIAKLRREGSVSAVCLFRSRESRDKTSWAMTWISWAMTRIVPASRGRGSGVSGAL